MTVVLLPVWTVANMAEKKGETPPTHSAHIAHRQVRETIIRIIHPGGGGNACTDRIIPPARGISHPGWLQLAAGRTLTGRMSKEDSTS